jgi:hypothetical protein
MILWATSPNVAVTELCPARFGNWLGSCCSKTSRKLEHIFLRLPGAPVFSSFFIETVTL